MPDQIIKENVNVKLPPGLHTRIKAAAITRTGTAEKAYVEALEDWLAKTGGRTSEARLSKVQSRVISDAILKLKEVIATLGNAQTESIELGTSSEDTAAKAETLLGRGRKPGNRSQVVPKHS